jgi:hypothetical protein
MHEEELESSSAPFQINLPRQTLDDAPDEERKAAAQPNGALVGANA